MPGIHSNVPLMINIAIKYFTQRRILVIVLHQRGNQLSTFKICRQKPPHMSNSLPEGLPEVREWMDQSDSRETSDEYTKTKYCIIARL